MLCCCHPPLILHYECQSRELSRSPHVEFTVLSHVARPPMLRDFTQRQDSALPACPVISFCVASPVALPQRFASSSTMGEGEFDLSSRNSDVVSVGGHLHESLRTCLLLDLSEEMIDARCEDWGPSTGFGWPTQLRPWLLCRGQITGGRFRCGQFGVGGRHHG